jgi:hypothetical protein
MAFAQGRTEYRAVYGNHYLVRGHIALPVKRPANFPPPVLDTLFWARWTGTPSDESLSESILLVGPTSYKYLALDYLMPKSANVYDMTRETQVSELVGSTILSNPRKIQDDTDHLRHAVRDALTERRSFDPNDLESGSTAMALKIAFRRERDSMELDPEHDAKLGVLRGAWFIHLALERVMTDVEEALSMAPSAGIPIVMCFSPSVVTKSALLGTPLVLRSIHLPPPSVLERLNSLLEDPRSLVLGEDTQRVFNNAELIRMVTESNSRSIPNCPGFCIAGTSTEAGFIGLSAPLQSRFTYIAVVPYSMQISPSPDPSNSVSDLRMIALNILGENAALLQAIEEIYQGLILRGRVPIGITEYVRWCKTAANLFSDNRDSIPVNFIAGISALRTIVDALSDSDRRRVTKNVLAMYLPQPLTYLVVTDASDHPEFRCPVTLLDSASGPLMKCDASTIILPAFPTASLDALSSVFWTQSAVDMAEAVLTAVAARAITIFEGSPGEAKRLLPWRFSEHLASNALALISHLRLQLKIFLVATFLNLVRIVVLPRNSFQVR